MDVFMPPFQEGPNRISCPWAATDFLYDRHAGECSQLYDHHTVPSGHAKPVRSMSAGTGSPNRLIAARGDTWPNLPHAPQAHQNGIAPLAPLGSSALALLLCWLSPPGP